MQLVCLNDCPLPRANAFVSLGTGFDGSATTCIEILSNTYGPLPRKLVERDVDTSLPCQTVWQFVYSNWFKLTSTNFDSVSTWFARVVLTLFKMGKRQGLNTKPSQFPFQTGYRTFDVARYSPRAQNSTYQIVSSHLVCFPTFSIKRLL